MADQLPTGTRSGLLTLAEYDGLIAAIPRGWLLHDMIPLGGLTILAGSSLVGKTRILAALSVAVASGQPTFAGRPIVAGPVVWLALEHNPIQIAKYLQDAAEGLGIDDWRALPIYIRHPFAGDWFPTDTALCDLEVDLTNIGAVLLVIDSFRAIGDSTQDDNASKEVRPMLRRVSRLTGEYRRNIVVIHHAVVGGKRMRGTDDFRGSSDSSIMLIRKGDALQLTADGRGVAQQTWKIRPIQLGDSLHYEAVERADKSGDKLTERQKEILSAVTDSEKPLTRNDIAGKVKGRKANVLLDVGHLVEKGYLHLGHGDTIRVAAA